MAMDGASFLPILSVGYHPKLQSFSTKDNAFFAEFCCIIFAKFCWFLIAKICGNKVATYTWG